MATNYLTVELVSHSKRVCSLYKRALRNMESWCNGFPHVYRFNAVLIRERFDKNAKELDMRKSKELYLLGEEELFKTMHYQPLKFPKSPGGVAYERNVEVPDWMLDFWHPSEKAQYPDYFARREIRKKEYTEMWEKKYGKPSLKEFEDYEEHHNLH